MAYTMSSLKPEACGAVYETLELLSQGSGATFRNTKIQDTEQ